jgi:hypothetical protein
MDLQRKDFIIVVILTYEYRLDFLEELDLFGLSAELIFVNKVL